MSGITPESAKNEAQLREALSARDQHGNRLADDANYIKRWRASARRVLGDGPAPAKEVHLSRRR